MEQADRTGEGGAEYSGEGDFDRLAARFEALRRLPQDDREQALAVLEHEDPHLTTLLRRLFAQHSEDPDELGAPEKVFAPAAIVDAVANAGADLPMPDRIGPYVPQRELGRGGMGTVYLAERQGGDFTQTVAVKLLRAAVDDVDLQRRFRTERRILAGLQHPNIATMHDGGTTAAGLPYVAMEYVDGVDLLSHCRERRLDVAARLRLFVKVCRAVAHAHRNLIVHRDLKPGNILVTANGEPKLLDFGIAKLLAADETTPEAAPATRTGHMLLTPEYSSPEQVRGEAITTATDVYSLGAILYELLCGRRAQTLPDRSVTTMLAVVCNGNAPPPSTAAPADDTTLRRRLRGDLDTIVAFAMRKEPERRYESAAALADDLERHLAGLPVRARADTFGYRATKFVRRHRLPLAGVALLLLLLVGFAVQTADQNEQIRTERNTAERRRQEAEKQRDIAQTQRAEAERQRQAAAQIAEFLVDLFSMASPSPERADALRARELLDRGARRIDLDMVTSPALRGALQLAMGRAYVALGLYPAARPLIEASEQSFAAASPGSEDHRSAQYWLGVLAMNQGRTAEGEEMLRQSFAPTADGAPCPPQIEALRCCTLATWLRDAGRFDEADAMLTRAEQLNGGTLVAHSKDETADLRIVRASVLRDRGDSRGALALLREVELEVEAEGNARQPRYLVLYRELGYTFKELGELDEARSAFEHTLRMSREYAGESHPDVDTALFSLAQLEASLGDLPRAEQLMRDCIAREEARFGPHSFYPALGKAQLASILGQLDRSDEAEAMFRDALAIMRDVLPPEHPELPTTLGNFGTFLHRIGRFDEAGPLFEEALARREKILPPEHPAILTSRNQLAVLRIDRGDPAGAEPDLRKVLDARRKQLGAHQDTAGSLLTLATAIARQGRDEEAIPLFEESIAMFGQVLPPDHPTQARPRIGLAISRIRMERVNEALEPLRDAVSIHHAAYGPDHPMTFYSEYWLAQGLALSGDPVAAIALLRPVQQRASASHPGETNERRIRQFLAELLEKSGDAAGAAALRR